MITDRQVDEAIARCVATMVYYHNCENRRQAASLIKHDLQSILLWACNAFGDQDAGRRLVRPIGSELFIRYGKTVGGYLSEDFEVMARGEIPPSAVDHSPDATRTGSAARRRGSARKSPALGPN